MAYDLKAVLSLTDNFTRPLKAITQQFSQFKKQSDEASGMARHFNSEMGRMPAFMNSAAASVAGLTAAYLTLQGAQSLLNATIGEAMRVDYARVSMQSMFAGDLAAAQELSAFIDDKAINSVMSYQEALTSANSFLTVTKDVGQIQELVNLTERLSYLNPLEGFEGAGFAIKEMLGGDMVSLKERFNLSSDQLAAIKSAASTTDKMRELDGLLNNIGVSTEYLGEVNDTTFAKWNKFTDSIRVAFRMLGEAALPSFGPMVDRLTAFLDSGEFSQFQEEAETAFSAVFSGLGEMATEMYNNRASIMDFASDTVTFLTDVGSVVKDVAFFFMDYWPQIRETVVGVGVAVLTFKGIMGGLAIIGTVTRLMEAWRLGTVAVTLAQMGLNTALWLNPLTWIVAGIAAVVAAGVLLYRNFDTIKEKLGGLWDSVDDYKNVLLGLLGPVGWVIAAGTELYDKWKPFHDLIEGIKDGWNSFTDLFSMPEMPSVTAPATFSSGATEMGGYTPSFSLPQADGSHYNGLKSVPYDGYMAKMHRGEEIRTAREVQQEKQGGGNTVNLTVHYNGGPKMDEADMDLFSSYLVRRINQAGGGGA